METSRPRVGMGCSLESTPPNLPPRPRARDPFRIDGPAVVSFSGGRTSGYMLRRILDAHGGVLLADVHVVFANTGKEFPATLDFVRDVGARWGVGIRWVEYTAETPGFREVDHATASRAGEPFAAMVTKERYLPNPVARICTKHLKVLTMQRFLRSLGVGEHTEVLGLRADEPSRVARLRARAAAGEDLAAPLADAGVTRADVMAFWAAQPFDLALRWWESNCDGCFLKGEQIRERIERDHPGTLAWWAGQETARGARFRPKRGGYAALAERARRPSLPVVFDPPADDPTALGDCTCTD